MKKRRHEAGGPSHGGRSTRSSHLLRFTGVDGRVKTEVWKEMIAFQQDATRSRLAFPATYSALERGYVHKVALNLQMDAKSSGSKAQGTRFVTVSKTGASVGAAKEKRDDVSPPLVLTPSMRLSIDRFVQSSGVEVKTAALIFTSHASSSFAFSGQPSAVSSCVQPAPSEAKGAASQLWKPPFSANRALRQTYLHNPRYIAMLPQRCKLPISAQREAILSLWQHNQVMVISGATGCGKSTQVPQFILEHIDSIVTEQGSCAFDGEIICTQPRRISAVSLAERVAAERGEMVGQSIGYQIRLEKKRSRNTRVLFCTVGILLRRLTCDRQLKGVSCLIIDEVHERERNCDFLLVFVRDLLPMRPDLKLVLMSATLNSMLFSDYFNNCPHLFCPGFTYPVQTFHLADVIELTGYNPLIDYAGGGSEISNSELYRRKRCTESRLQASLDSLVRNQLFTRSDEVVNANDILMTANSTELDDEQARLMLKQRDLAHSQAIGWTDTYKFTSSNELDKYGKLSSTGNVDQSQDEQMASLMHTIRHSTDSTTREKVLIHKNVHDRENKESDTRHVNIQVMHSESTLTAVSKLDDDGMDYIDYSLVVATLHYICTSFATDTRSSQPRLVEHKRGVKAVANHRYDVDVANGSILVFLPGWEDINNVSAELREHPHFSQQLSSYRILPLHGSIATNEQRLIFAPPVPGIRKIILSTNIAETSITIDDVVFVVDTGKMKEKVYDPHSKMSSLQSIWISRANAKQRSGRAGRSRPGVCFRLYSQIMYEMMSEHSTPELLRTPLEEVCLQIKLLEVPESIMLFLSRCLEPPSHAAIQGAIRLLTDLGALTNDEQLTDLGQCLAALPLDPRLGRMILYAVAFQCLDPIITIAACLSYRDPFLMPRLDDRSQAQDMKHSLAHEHNCDLMVLLHAYQGYKDASKQSTGAGFQYCRKYFLQHSTMSLIDDMKKQLLSLLEEAGVLEGGVDSSNLAQRYNMLSNDLLVVHAICVAGLYPNCAKVIYSGNRKRIPSLCTRDHLNNLRIHPGSVNSGKHKLTPIRMPAAISKRRENQQEVEISLWVMYNEIVRSTEIFLRSTSLATPLTLALLLGHCTQPEDPCAVEDDNKQATIVSNDFKKPIQNISNDDKTRDNTDKGPFIEAFSYDDLDNDEAVSYLENELDTKITMDPKAEQAMFEELQRDLNSRSRNHQQWKEDPNDELLDSDQDLDVEDEHARSNALLEIDNMNMQMDLYEAEDQLNKVEKKSKKNRSNHEKASGNLSKQPLVKVDDFVTFSVNSTDLSRINKFQQVLRLLLYKRIVKIRENLGYELSSQAAEAASALTDNMEAELLSLFSSVLKDEAVALNLSAYKNQKEKNNNARDVSVPRYHYSAFANTHYIPHGGSKAATTRTQMYRGRMQVPFVPHRVRTTSSSVAAESTSSLSIQVKPLYNPAAGAGAVCNISTSYSADVAQLQSLPLPLPHTNNYLLQSVPTSFGQPLNPQNLKKSSSNPKRVHQRKHKR